VLLLLFACDAPAPATLADCPTLSSPTAIEDCRYEHIEPHLSDPRSLQADLALIDDETSRDLLLLRLAVNHPDKASLLCRLTVTPPAQQKCQQVLGRPHLSTRPR